MRFILLLVSLLAMPSVVSAAPCSNPRTCEAPAWLKNPPKGTFVAKGSTRLEALAKALLQSGQFMQNMLNQHMAGYAKGDAGGKPSNTLLNQKICGLKMKGMTKEVCETAGCKKGQEKTTVVKVSMGDGLEIKMMKSEKTAAGKTESEINVSMTGKNLGFMNLLKTARKECVINEVFAEDMIWVALKLVK